MGDTGLRKKSDMNSQSCVVAIDAIPHQHSVINENVCKPKNVDLNSVLDDLTAEEFKSVFFLLMDYVGMDNFLSLTKKEKCQLKEKFCEIYDNFNGNYILIELFGTLKMYNKLSILDMCRHTYSNSQETFNHIDSLWKMLYSICEELTGDELENFKSIMPEKLRNEIIDAEDWFCCALQKEIFSKTDLSNLETIFLNYPRYLDIIRSFKGNFKSYIVRTPTADSDCGIALIFNYEVFDESLNLKKRVGSYADVESLKHLWHVFGFKTVVFHNQTYAETITELKCYAKIDHSDYDAFVCCFLSHGRSNSVISYDGIDIPIPSLIASITNYCPSLESKPKLFFIQACQGRCVQQGVGKPVYEVQTADSFTTSVCSLKVPPIASDVLLAISSIDGFVSFLSESGSWFIKSLYESMMQYGDSRSILDVITEVNNKVRQYSANFGARGPKKAQQIINCTTSLAKTLILKKRIS